MAFMADVVLKNPAVYTSLLLSAWWATFTLARKCFTNVVSLGLKMCKNPLAVWSLSAPINWPILLKFVLCAKSCDSWYCTSADDPLSSCDVLKYVEVIVVL